MKKTILLILMALVLVGCVNPFQTTEKKYAQLSEADLENIKTQILNEIREDFHDEYFSQISEMEQKIISLIKTYGGSVLGVSNYKEEYGILLQKATGSGVIYKKDQDKDLYYMITNEHVIRDADAIGVVLEDKTVLDATLIGKDANTDLAVITFQTTLALPVAKLGDSSKLEKGQYAIAVGNPLGYDYYGSVTVGHISGLSRAVEVDYESNGTPDWIASLIQHDAAISPGNSGGALFDIAGNVIGINNMKIVSDTVTGIGFAIPINTVIEIVEELEEHGKITRPTLGVSVRDVAEILQFNNMIESGIVEGEIIPIPLGVKTGVYVAEITPNSNAGRSDLKVGDIITKFNSVEIKNVDKLRFQIEMSQFGEEISLRVLRGGRYIVIHLVLTKD